ncbi:hypothetical protein AAXE64_27120 [Priestia megaterium]
MNVMCFDLSSTCIGITFAQLRKQKPIFVRTLAVIPQLPTGKTLGYTTQEPKEIHSNGNVFKGFLKPGESRISKAEATRRLSEFKVFKHRELLKDIGKQCGRFLYKVNPSIVALERNKAFNGVLTTKLLAEIAGGIYFYAGSKNADLHDEDEATIRAKIRKDMAHVNVAEDGVVALNTKWEIYKRLQWYFETNYPGLVDFSKMTMDESDSLAVFYHLLTTHLS